MNYRKISSIIILSCLQRVVLMENYRFTAFEKTGETLFDEIWTFENDATAKIEGQQQINEKGIAEKTHRLINSTGKIILYHV